MAVAPGVKYCEPPKRVEELEWFVGRGFSRDILRDSNGALAPEAIL